MRDKGCGTEDIYLYTKSRHIYYVGEMRAVGNRRISAISAGRHLS